MHGRLAITTILVMAMILSAVAQAQTTPPPRALVEWEAPLQGAPVVLWEIQVKVRHGPPTEVEPILVPVDAADPEAGAVPGSHQSFLLPEGIFLYDAIYRTRVRGFDAQGRAGEWSAWVDCFFPTPDPARARE